MKIRAGDRIALDCGAAFDRRGALSTSRMALMRRSIRSPKVFSARRWRDEAFAPVDPAFRVHRAGHRASLAFGETYFTR